MKVRGKLGISLARVGVAMLLAAAGPASAQGPSHENHFRCYIVSQQMPQPAVPVTLEDQFTTAPVPVMVGEPVMFCPPTAKTATSRFRSRTRRSTTRSTPPRAPRPRGTSS